MNMTVTERAGKWFEEEMGVHKGDAVQFFVRYGGDANFQSGFSLAVALKKPDEPALMTELNGITFYVEQKDSWYFDNTDFTVDYDDDIGEIRYLHG
ncbi:HesB/YadR/YfhF family protein [Salisediminibacterium halotolerans]|uniref:HesB/YadR/YfhF family protein n=1 Tax=Salisediminibacterium halotolerans TaxID=517425 RepID=UPI000EB0DA15|nr:HesB/YadR/YfhF family protein [Salisediminibacterium halotolerans]RLJ74454.1 uncharacterized protein YneR [Actinophytocola xinjiangensis]RPE87453.1 uncharacterized protein YneR [Salisediminibacterium halotolerans]TWG35290.1 uncharacterized protein YneR [Salisediminibacterium halotolerans]GEL06772.1 hypothetical protein SHA02_01880 [Salisediminibacterium halotolerans]